VKKGERSMHTPDPTILLPLLSMTAVSAPLARKPANPSVLSLRLIRIVGANVQWGIQLIRSGMYRARGTVE